MMRPRSSDNSFSDDPVHACGCQRVTNRTTPFTHATSHVIAHNLACICSGLRTNTEDARASKYTYYAHVCKYTWSSPSIQYAHVENRDGNTLKEKTHQCKQMTHIIPSERASERAHVNNTVRIERMNQRASQVRMHLRRGRLRRRP